VELVTLPLPATVKPLLEKEIANLVASVVGEKKDVQKQAIARAEEIIKRIQENNSKVVIDEIDCGQDRKALSNALSAIKEKCPDCAVLLMSKDDKKIAIIAAVPKALCSHLNAAEW